MLAANLALRDVQFFQAESYFILFKSSSNFNDSSLNRISFKQKSLQESISSKSLTNMNCMPFIQIAEAQIKEFKNFIATEKMMNNFEKLAIIGDRILGQPELSNLIVRLKAAH